MFNNYPGQVNFGFVCLLEDVEQDLDMLEFLLGDGQ